MRLKLLKVRESTGERIGNPHQAYQMLKEVASADRECLWVLHLNSQMEVIEKELVALGTLDQSLCFPREISRKRYSTAPIVSSLSTTTHWGALNQARTIARYGTAWTKRGKS